MCRPDWPMNWQAIPKHRKATTRDWDKGKVLEWSSRIGSQSQYNPYSYGSDEAVSELEMKCVENGEPILAAGIKRTFYLNTFATTGVCLGE